jgi:DNA-directed RNA polymerase subunit RPC12/RpoP
VQATTRPRTSAPADPKPKDHPIDQAIDEFLTSASIRATRKLCPKCGSRLLYRDVTFFHGEQSWNVPLPICVECHSNAAGTPATESDLPKQKNESDPNFIRCPHCVEDGELRSMVVTDSPDLYICIRCGHLTMIDNPLFECRCSKCMEKALS